jgi:hypothetical protein
MDPNECLRKIRNLVEKSSGKELDSFEVDMLCELFQALDDWIMRGGFLPEQWLHALPGYVQVRD